MRPDNTHSHDGTKPRRKGRIDPTSYILPTQRRNARNAFLFAAYLGKPLNTFLTITLRDWRGPDGWVAGAPADIQVKSLRRRVFKTLSDWFRRQDMPGLWVAAMENPPQGGYGSGIHILLHLPAPEWLEKRTALHGCLRKMMGWNAAELTVLEAEKKIAPKPETVHLPFYFSDENRTGPLIIPDQERRLAYMVKGCSPDEKVAIAGVCKTLADHNGDLARGDVIKLEPQGHPYTKRRIEVSRILSRKARASTEWQEDNDDSWISRDARLAQRKNAVLAMLNGKFRPLVAISESPPENANEPELALEAAIRALESPGEPDTSTESAPASTLRPDQTSSDDTLDSE